MKKNGFTLVELLAVIVLLGILMVITIPVINNTAQKVRESNFETLKSTLGTTMIKYASEYYIDDIKPGGNICDNNNCCAYFDIDYIAEYNIYQSTNGKIINPLTGQQLQGYIKVSYDVDNLDLVAEYKENADGIGYCLKIYLDDNNNDNNSDNNEYTIINLIPDGSFENNGWNNAEYDSSNKVYGSKSLKLVGTTSIPEKTSSSKASIPLISTHIYYASVYAKTSGAPSLELFWPIVSGGNLIKYNISTDWTKYSWRFNKNNFTDGNYPVRLDNNNNKQSNTMNFDGLIIVDLTAAFGAGNEPSLEWCDENIDYFDGTKIVYK